MIAKSKNLKPPVVAILGHVDHGKTTLLDYIRKTKVAEKESGGITQHVGAHEIVHNKKKLTFLDTPGHEAFSAIRSRGAAAADIAILVIAADEGIKPQTKESLTYIQEAKIPTLVALTKTDKSSVNLDRIKKSIVEGGVPLEGLGGDIPYVEISAKSGKGINELLDMIQLISELHPKNFDPIGYAEGVVVETHLNSRKGNIVSIVVQNGLLKIGDFLVTATSFGKVRRLEDDKGDVIDSAQPSKPVLVFGFSVLPKVGEILKAAKESEKNKVQAELKDREKKFEKEEKKADSPKIGKKDKINFIIRADAIGSLEAINKILKDLPGVKFIRESLGDLSDGDIKLAQATGSAVLLFRTKVPKSIANLILDAGVPVIESDIIYELKEKIEEFLKIADSLKEKKPNLFTVLKVFNRTHSKITLGGKVESGRMKADEEVEIMRGEKRIGRGKITNLQSQKTDTKVVNEGSECGLLLVTKYEVVTGDILKGI